MAILTKEEILGADDLRIEEVDVPEWGGEVLVRGLSGAERDAFEAEIVTVRGKETSFDVDNFRAKLAARCMVDVEGTRLFGDNEVKALGMKSASALQKVFEVAQRLSGLKEEDVEELVKN